MSRTPSKAAQLQCPLAHLIRSIYILKVWPDARQLTYLIVIKIFVQWKKTAWGHVRTNGTATLLVKHHGEDAPIEVAMRADVTVGRTNVTCKEVTIMEWSSLWTLLGSIASLASAVAIGIAVYQLWFNAWVKAQDVFTSACFTKARTAVFFHTSTTQRSPGQT